MFNFEMLTTMIKTAAASRGVSLSNAIEIASNGIHKFRGIDHQALQWQPWHDTVGAAINEVVKQLK